VDFHESMLGDVIQAYIALESLDNTMDNMKVRCNGREAKSSDLGRKLSEVRR
jgi:hypothetical protein